MAAIPRVALLIETSPEYGRDVLRGVMRYARLHGHWAFHITPGDFMQAVPKVKQWGGTGVIARIETPASERPCWLRSCRSSPWTWTARS